MAIDKRPLSIRAALDWAFVNECARLEIDDKAPTRDNVSTEYVLMQRAKLGTKVDLSGGRSLPHDDADRLASVVSRCLAPDLARLVYEYARLGMMPDWMPGSVAKIAPLTWNTKSRQGKFGKVETLASYTETFEVPHPKNPTRMIERRRKVLIEWVPITWEIHPQEIASARLEYATWWSSLAMVKAQAEKLPLRSIEITDEMPPFQPWRARTSASSGGT